MLIVLWLGSLLDWVSQIRPSGGGVLTLLVILLSLWVLIAAVVFLMRTWRGGQSDLELDLTDLSVTSTNNGGHGDSPGGGFPYARGTSGEWYGPGSY